jgi:hypothetical protein
LPKSVDKLIDFVLVGAPKCGTTSLASWLSNTSGIKFTDPKEPHFFNIDHNDPWRPSRAQYEKIVRRVNDNDLVGEGSVWYLLSRCAISEIEKENPQCRYIICIRNPVDMAISLHQQQLYSGNEDVECFEKAWRLCSERRKGNRIPHTCPEPAFIDYQVACKLGSQIERVLSQVEASRVKLVFLDDLSNCSMTTYKSILHFLGIPFDGTVTLEHLNSAKVRRYLFFRRVTKSLGLWKSKYLPLKGLGILKYLDSLNSYEKKIDQLDEKFKKDLYDFFFEDIKLLERLSGRDLSNWKNIQS